MNKAIAEGRVSLAHLLRQKYGTADAEKLDWQKIEDAWLEAHRTYGASMIWDVGVPYRRIFPNGAVDEIAVIEGRPKGSPLPEDGTPHLPRDFGPDSDLEARTKKYADLHKFLDGVEDAPISPDPTPEEQSSATGAGKPNLEAKLVRGIEHALKGDTTKLERIFLELNEPPGSEQEIEAVASTDGTLKDIKDQLSSMAFDRFARIIPSKALSALGYSGTPAEIGARLFAEVSKATPAY